MATRVSVLLVLALVLLCSTPATPTGSVLESLKCSTCKALGGLAVSLLRLTRSSDVIRGQAKSICKLLPVSEAVCLGYVDRWAEPVTFILLHTDLSAAQICGIFLDSCPKREPLTIDLTLDLPEPPGPAQLTYRENKYPPPDTFGLNVLHIADLHLDHLYREGADNSCPDVLCCRAENGFPSDPGRRAGRWGDYKKCDSPPRLLHSMMGHIAAEHKGKLDYIMWTGDTAPHDSWKTSRADVMATTSNVTSLLRHHFSDVPVFPVIGNHDSAPTDSFPPPEVWKRGFSVSWLYNTLADMWKPWLPPRAEATFRRRGYYSIRVRPGFRVIVLNTNVAYRYNLWVVLTARSDSHGQLKWLAGELRAAKRAGEKCHIIGHVSPADPDILPAWSHLYHTIVKSYKDTITAQFFSHTHVDEIQLYKTSRNLPFSVSYVAPSLTPWKNVNPGYRIYRIDGARGPDSTWEVLDFERWTADLAEANSRPALGPRWVRQYSAASLYRLPALSPKHWSRLVNKMLVRGRVFAKYYRHLSGVSVARKPCNQQCRQDVVCNIVTSDRSNPVHCQMARLMYKLGTSMGLR